MTKISAIVHTKNSADTLEEALQSLDWVDELLVVDMESRDDSVEIARRYADRVLETPPAPRVDGIRNRFVLEAASEWILVLDSDEYLSADAEAEIRALVEEEGARFDAFALPRFNYVGGELLRGRRWYPDHQVRLFRKGRVSWGDSTHILPVVTTGPHRLKGLTPPDCVHIHHRNYADLREFIRRQLEYALRDRYPAESEGFDYSDYVSQAYEQLGIRLDDEEDGDLSHALALVMAWDSLIRGLIHWDSLQPRPPLGYLKALPVAAEKVPWWRIQLNRLIGRRHSFSFVASRPAEILRWWWWKRKNRRKVTKKLPRDRL